MPVVLTRALTLGSILLHAGCNLEGIKVSTNSDGSCEGSPADATCVEVNSGVSDAGAPVVSGKSPTNDKTPTWTWVSGGGGSGIFRYRLDGGDLSAGATETFENSYTPTAELAAGNHILHVQERDNNGMWSASGNRLITIDTTPPGVFSINAITSPAADTAHAISWTDSFEAASYELAIASSSTCDSPVQSYTSLSETNLDISGLGNGTWYVCVTAKDLAGNILNASNQGYSFVIDTTAPTAPSVTGTTPTNDSTPTWSWTAGGGGNGTFRYKLDNSDLSTGATATTNNNFTPGSALSAGNHTLYVQERSASGSWSASGSLLIHIDTTAPAAFSITGPATPTNVTTPTVSWDAATDSGAVTYVLKVASTSNCTAGTVAQTYPVPPAVLSGTSQALTTLAEGTWYACLTATDAAGNSTNATNNGYSFVIDTTAPTAPSVTGTTPTNDSTPTWSWTAGGGGNGTFRYKLDSSDLSTGAPETTSTSFTPASAISEDNHTLYVQERDEAGNWSASGSQQITIDTTAPGTFSIDSIASPASSATPQISWSGSSGASSYDLAIASASGCASPTQSYTGITATSKVLTALDNGTWYVCLTAKDAAGNSTGASNTNYSFTVAMPVTPASLTATADVNAVQLSWPLSDENAGYLVARSEGSAVTGSPVNGTLYAPGQTLSDGSVVVQVGKSKAAGDYGLNATSTYHYAIWGLSGYPVKYSASARTASAQVSGTPSFGGISAALLVSPSLVRAWWEPRGNCSQSPYSGWRFDVFSATSSGGQNFNSPLASTTDPCVTGLTFAHGLGSSSPGYFVAREGSSGDSNTRQYTTLATGSHHIVAGLGHNGSPASTARATGAAYRDRWGNLVYQDLFTNTGTGNINALCVENTQAPYCTGKTVNAVYTIAGGGGQGDYGQGGVFPYGNGMGSIKGLTVDSHGNVYWVEWRFSDNNGRLRALCYRTNVPGGCNGKTAGLMYTLGGTGTGGPDSADGVDPLTVGFQQSTSVAVDLFGNLFYQGGTRVRAICYETGSGVGLCAGKSAGRHYRVSGGWGDSSSEVAISSLLHHDGANISVDDFGNILMADGSRFKVRELCYETRVNGGCLGKTSGNAYTTAGIPEWGNSSTGESALSARLGTPLHVRYDYLRNLYIADAGNWTARVVCFETGVNGVCTGQTIGYTYRLWTGSYPNHFGFDTWNNQYYIDPSNWYYRVICRDKGAGRGYCDETKTNGTVYSLGGTVPNQGVDGAAPMVGIASANTVATDALGNVFFTDGYGETGRSGCRVRALCTDTSGGYCAGKTAGNIYSVIGKASTNYACEDSDPADDSAPLETGIYSTDALKFDSNGNLFFSTRQSGWGGARRAMVYCLSTSGICNGKNSGKIYRVLGGGSSVDDDSLPGDLFLRNITGLSFDPQGNIYISQVDNYSTNKSYLRVYCRDNSAGACLGRSVGKVYRLAGTGTDGDGADDTTAGPSYQIGYNSDVVVNSNGNIFFADNNNRRVRAICFKVDAGDYCQDKTVGKAYRMIGSGSAGDPADGAAFTSGIGGNVNALTLDSAGNLLIGFGWYYRVTLACFNTSGLCNGKDANKLYRYAGNHSGSNGATNTARSDAGFGHVAGNGLAIATGNILYMADTYGKIRMFLP